MLLMCYLYLHDGEQAKANRGYMKKILLDTFD